jgi:hypothetical protein
MALVRGAVEEFSGRRVAPVALWWESREFGTFHQAEGWTKGDILAAGVVPQAATGRRCAQSPGATRYSCGGCRVQGGCERDVASSHFARKTRRLERGYDFRRIDFASIAYDIL